VAEQQGEGEIKKGLGAPILDILESRSGTATIVRLVSGQEVLVYNSAWGRDMGDRWEHVTTNCSPFVEGQSIDFFLTSHVVNVSDAASGLLLFVQEPRPNET